MKREPRFFNANKSTKICSEHFKREDFSEPDSKKKRLNYKAGVVPSIFRWTKNVSHQRSTSVIEKLDSFTRASASADTSSDKDLDLCSQQAKFVSRETQTSESSLRVCCANGSTLCSHRFSVSHLRSKCTSRNKEVKLFTHFTGFNSYEEFDNSLQLFCLDLFEPD